MKQIIIPKFEYWDKGLDEYRTFENLGKRQDWLSIVKSIADLIHKQCKNKTNVRWLLDIGSGDGYTLFQFLAFLPKSFKKKLSIDCIEPSQGGIKLMKKQFQNREDWKLVKHIFRAKWKGKAVHDKYDIITMIHVNYYIAKSKQAYNQRLKDLIGVLTIKGLGIVVTLPEKSDYYKMARAVGYDYPKFIYAEYTRKFLKELDISVFYFNKKMRFRAPKTFKEKISFWSLVLHKWIKQPFKFTFPHQMNFNDEIIWFVKN